MRVLVSYLSLGNSSAMLAQQNAVKIIGNGNVRAVLFLIITEILDGQISFSKNKKQTVVAVSVDFNISEGGN